MLTLARPLAPQWERVQNCVARLRASRGHLFAFGGGSDSQRHVYPLFLEHAGGAVARIAVVPVASSRAATREAYLGLFRSKGVADVWIVDPEGEQANHPVVDQVLRYATGICVTGGDQKMLARTLRNTRAARSLDACLRAGTPLFTTSAATDALSHPMVAGLDRDDRVRTGPGLGLIPGITFETHVNTRNRHPRLADLVARGINALTIGLDEDTALHFLPGTCRAVVLGVGEVTVMAASGPASVPVRLRAGQVLDVEAFIPQ